MIFRAKNTCNILHIVVLCESKLLSYCQSGSRPTLFCELIALSNFESEYEMSRISDIVSKLARPVVEEEGCSLWDVEYVKEAGTWFLRIYIDKEGGLSIDDCERISRRLDPMLDEADPIPDSDVFEVGSAGAERELKRPSDFQQFMGAQVEVRLYQPIDGSKVFVGELAGYDNGDVSIVFAGQTLTFEKGKTAQVKLHVSI